MFDSLMLHESKRGSNFPVVGIRTFLNTKTTNS